VQTNTNNVNKTRTEHVSAFNVCKCWGFYCTRIVNDSYYGSYGDGKSILQIVNFSVRDEDMNRCEGVHDKKIVEICFNIHMCSK
jgi:hypothetical protein